MKLTTRVFVFLGSVVALVATFLLAYMYTSTVIELYNRPKPVIPYGYVMIGERLVGCTQPFYPEAYGQAYAPEGSQYARIVVYGKVTLIPEAGVHYGHPVLWVFYPKSDVQLPFSESTYRIVNWPSKDPEYLTHDELKTRFPRGACSPEIQALP